MNALLTKARYWRISRSCLLKERPRKCTSKLLCFNFLTCKLRHSFDAVLGMAIDLSLLTDYLQMYLVYWFVPCVLICTYLVCTYLYLFDLYQFVPCVLICTYLICTYLYLVYWFVPIDLLPTNVPCVLCKLHNLRT